MIERVEQIAWTLDHLDDLDSDFSVFHRADSFRSLPAPRMFALAQRLPAYGGVMSVRAQDYEPDPDEPEPGGDEVSSDAHTLTTHPGLAGLIEIGA